MSDIPTYESKKSIIPSWIRGPQDFVGGIALIALALFALWACSDLPGIHGYSFGAGTTPRIFAILLLGLGAIITVTGLLVAGPKLANFSWRGPLFVTLAILSFSVSIQSFGVVISSLLSFMIAALATPETRWKETMIVGIILTTFCSLLFPYALGLPLELFPQILR